MKLITDAEIHDTLTKKYLKDVQINDSKQALVLLPKVIEIMEKEYKKLLGTSKKQLVIEVVVCLMKAANADTAEIDLVKIILPDLIDNIVNVLNTAGKIFRQKSKQTKKCCVRIKRNE